jgi:hypothetical protein
MARYNSIYAGPYTQATPQVREAICGAAVMPGTAVVWSGANFAQAGAASAAKVMIVQDNYLTMKDTETAWLANDRVTALEILDDQLLNVLIPTGQTILRGSELTTNATGRFVLAVATNKVIFQAEEAYTNASGVDQLVRVRAVNGYVKA